VPCAFVIVFYFIFHSSATSDENSGSATGTVLTQAPQFAGSIAQAAQAATAAAIAAAVSAAHAAGVPNITIVRGGQAQGSQETVNIRIEGNYMTLLAKHNIGLYCRYFCH